MTIYSNTPYTYRLRWNNSDISYYGVRYSKKCDPSDLFVTYFTSSKYVKAYIIQNGLPDVIEVRKTFTGTSKVNEAREWEHRVLKKLNVPHNLKFLNRSTGKGIDPILASMARTGVSPGNKGLPQSENIKNKKRKPKEIVKCSVCGKSGGISSMHRHHFENCGKPLNSSTVQKLSNANKKNSQREIVQEILKLRNSLTQSKQRKIIKMLGLKPGWYQLSNDELKLILEQYSKLICHL